MLNKYFTFYKVYREKARLYQFIKNVYVEKIKQVEESLVYANDISYTILALENTKLLNNVNTKTIVEISKQIIHNCNISILGSAQIVVDLLKVLTQNLQANDFRLYREIYQFYKRHSQFFNQQQIEYIIGRVFVTLLLLLAKQVDFNDLIQIDEHISSLKYTQNFKFVKSDIYQIKKSEEWNIMIKEDSQQLNSAAILTHKNGIILRIQGVFQNNYEKKKPDIVILNIAPNQKVKELDVEKTINSMNQSEKEEEENFKQVFLYDLDPLIEKLTKKYKVQNEKNILTGFQQGFQVSYVMESLLYQFSQLRKYQKQPIFILGGLSLEDQIRLYVQTFSPAKITQELWLNQLLSNFSYIEKNGCILCNSQPGSQTFFQFLKTKAKYQKQNKSRNILFQSNFFSIRKTLNLDK